MSSINPYEVTAYVIEWRPYVNNGWQRLRSAEDFESAVATAEDLHCRFAGQIRIVSQGVVHADGLGAREFIPTPIREAADREPA